MRFGGIVLVALLTLGACSSDPAPQEPKPSATVAPTGSPPTMPPQASEDSPAGAAAFVDHYVDVFNYAASTGDVDELSRLSAPNCEGCQRYITLYRETYRAGGYFKGGDWKISRIESEGTRYFHRVFARVMSESGSQVQRHGTSEGPTTGENAELIFVYEVRDGSPRMLKLTRSVE